MRKKPHVAYTIPPENAEAVVAAFRRAVSCRIAEWDALGAIEGLLDGEVDASELVGDYAAVSDVDAENIPAQEILDSLTETITYMRAVDGE